MEGISTSVQLNYNFDSKHLDYMKRAKTSTYNIAEGAVRAGKTVDNVLAFSLLLETSEDKFHLASGSTTGNAKLNIGACNGYGLENIFRGRCRWGKHLDNEALFINTATGQKIVIFSGGGKSDSFKSIRGNSYGYWIATEIDQHHKNFIEEGLARQLMAKDMKLFWDLNPNNPKHWIYQDYIDKWGERDMSGGYNYQHFTIFDNKSLTEQRIKDIASRWTPGTLQHSRNILGMRMVAEGVIYKTFAENQEDYLISYEEAKKLHYVALGIGVDIGGNSSKHTFVLTGITPTMKLIVLRSIIVETDLDPELLALEYIRFARKCLADFKVQTTYFESAEQVLKKGFITKSRQMAINIPIRDSIKNEVKARIDIVDTLIAQNRFQYTEKAFTVRDALAEALWSRKEAEKGLDVRLDDGSTDIDTLDAFEYSFEKHINRLIRFSG